MALRRQPDRPGYVPAYLKYELKNGTATTDTSSTGKRGERIFLVDAQWLSLLLTFMMHKKTNAYLNIPSYLNSLIARQRARPFLQNNNYFAACDYTGYLLWSLFVR